MRNSSRNRLSSGVFVSARESTRLKMGNSCALGAGKSGFCRERRTRTKFVSAEEPEELVSRRVGRAGPGGTIDRFDTFATAPRSNVAGTEFGQKIRILRMELEQALGDGLRLGCISSRGQNRF